MKYFVVLSTDGTVASAGRGQAVPAGAIEVPFYTGSLNALGRMMNTPGGLVERPTSPGVQSAGNMHTIANMPLGTTIDVYDVSGDEPLGRMTADTEGMSETVNLPDPGTYDITVSAPAPALPIVVRVTT